MSSLSGVLWLSEADVRLALAGANLIPTMEAALKAFSSGEAVQPVRTVVPITGTAGVLAAMPGFVPPQQALGAKLVTFVPDNPRRGVPTHLAMVALFDAVTGALLALMDGRYITEVRTAAVSALSVRALARPDARRLGVLGSGIQARSHISLLGAEGRFEQVSVWGPEAAQVERLASDLSTERMPVAAAATAEEVVTNSDVVVLATSSPVPVIQSGWVRPGTHVVAIGACRPNQREMDPVLIGRSRLFVDSREAAAVESGDIVMAIAEGHFEAGRIAGELGQVLLGAVPGRTGRDEITVFKSLGLAVEDILAAQAAYQAAVERNIGTTLPI
jgi:ornithine cyclodeaminase/alanine dehydrogenase-like protein (mu-crystallin family)